MAAATALLCLVPPGLPPETREVPLSRRRTLSLSESLVYFTNFWFRASRNTPFFYHTPPSRNMKAHSWFNSFTLPPSLEKRKPYYSFNVEIFFSPPTLFLLPELSPLRSNRFRGARPSVRSRFSINPLYLCGIFHEESFEWHACKGFLCFP